MGVGVSGWRLARAVSSAGQLGVVSGVGLDTLLVRRLQLGDPGGHLRRALAAFPFPGVAERILRLYFRAGGIEAGVPFRAMPRPSLGRSRPSAQVVVAANFVEVFLAKQGHAGPVGVNYLEKLQMSTPAAVYGAMLAGVDFVLMGAGIPAETPALLGSLAAGRPGEVTVSVQGGAPGKAVAAPEELFGAAPELGRPSFLAIVSSNMLASYLARDARTRPDGFVVESPIAGGHNAPPRGRLALDAEGQPVYGPRDVVDLEKMSELGLPYWLAGGQASPRSLLEALRVGAAGIQVGSAFALCRESGLDASLRQALLERAASGTLAVRADPLASPTGFPFQLASLPGTVADDEVYSKRPRVCDVGYLRAPYARPDGTIGYRCPAEPVADYIRKGGRAEDAVGRRCLCNGLIAAIGLGQRARGGDIEPPLLTLGQDLSFLGDLLTDGDGDYTAADVVGYLLDTHRATSAAGAPYR